MSTFQGEGGCHCGKVRYQVTGDFSRIIDCNCSHCSKKGLLLAFIPAQQFNLLRGEDGLGEYRFNKKVIQHLFCKSCGVQSFSRGDMPDGTKMVAINVRCLDGYDISSATIQKVDGQSS